MFDNVKGKPVRGILSDVQFSRVNGNCTAILSSPDFCDGQEGRNYLEQGRSIYTSDVEAFDVVEGQLVVITENSAYIVEGEIGIWEVTVEKRQTEWLDECEKSPTMTASGLVENY